MMEPGDLPRAASLLARLIPVDHRDGILGDLLEDCAYRDVGGARRSLWLSFECGIVAAGMTADRLRAVCVPPTRDLASGLVSDGARALRGVRNGPLPALLSAALFGASTTLIAFGVALLVSTLLSAAGLSRP
jgi:hypothetical protein